jgi:gliding motility-associated-like protein
LVFFDSTICQGNVVQIGAQSYAQSGSYLDTLQTTQGCDSIISLNLTVRPFFDVEIDTAVVVCEEAFVAGSPIFGDTVLVENLLASTGCDSTVRYVITAIEKPQTNFPGLAPFCLGDSLTLRADALPGARYQWSTGDAGPQIRVQTGGTYALTTEVQFCQWTDSVQVPEPIDLQLSYDFSPLICAGTQAGFLTILEQAQGISPLQWSLNGELFDSLSRRDGLSGGLYRLGVEDAIGCRAESEFIIDTLPRLQANLLPTLELGMGESYALNLETNRDPADIAQVRWSPDRFVSCQDCLDPILQQAVSSQRYEVQIRDTFGCEVRLPLALRVIRQDRVFLPTAFSPNGDGINDELRVFFGPEVGQVLHFQIYSRWGTLVSEQTQPPLVSPLSWDGTSGRGQAVPEGVYLIVLRYAYLDGLVRTVSGSVTVIR